MRLKLAGAVGVVAIGAVIAAPAGGTPPAGAAATCRPASNIEAIIDDSSSMGFTDPSRLRLSAVDLLMRTQGNERRSLGAIEFGTDARFLFNPVPMAANRVAILGLLNQRIQATDGSTDYNDAFTLARTANPSANARIFLTDGGHNEGTYGEGHRGGPATHVIGLGSTFVRGTTDGDRLRRIARETGGVFRSASDASELQAAMASASAAIQCASRPVSFTDLFSSTRQRKRHSFRVPKRTRKILFTLSWTNPNDRFDIGAFRIVRRGKTVAASRARKLRVRRRRGATFLTVKVTRLKRGRLRFRVRPRKLASPGGVKLITQASRSRRR
jgi:hypothetical protein